MVNGFASRQESTAETFSGRYQPRSGAKALVTSDRAVLLVRERHSDGTPFWTLPGGGVSAHETPTEGLRRELVEELGCRARIDEPVSTFWYAHDSLAASVSVYTVFDCDLLSEPAPNPAEGVFEAQWAEPDALPPATLPQVRYLCANAVASD
ncbi:NUDIX hydrolase [Haloarcula salinisoli]|uniref:NUDIX domain-containing protein n=1 Tax=Haloarcula salinisoli TaxID=2487746 RepID=A0A8J8C9H9_9EURY|nr:NUDIX domain-containing protein [Halomicroarcula salinisoli]MBX0286927.1 NUDIX domain-containing protein [Halomicroarcula salinisoli]MBX0304229.1 NUDIX domain-containing protein [Halomicroarcula salinisoli]